MTKQSQYGSEPVPIVFCSELALLLCGVQATIQHGAHGVAQDMSKAIKAYEAASDAGHWRAPYTLATLVSHPAQCTHTPTPIIREQRVGGSRPSPPPPPPQKTVVEVRARIRDVHGPDQSWAYMTFGVTYLIPRINTYTAYNTRIYTFTRINNIRRYTP